jgi:hypothetical protein
LDVDPDNGAIHVIFYDTRDDPDRKKTHVYYIRSDDGGNTWKDETRVTTASTDETGIPADLGNQYGDYNGLVAYRTVAHPVWTDRRAGVPGNKEQIFTAKIGAGGEVSLTLQPGVIDDIDPGETTLITATLKDGNGAPLPGVMIHFSSDDTNIAMVTPATTATTAAGIAKATVKGVNKGETDIKAEAQNQGATAHVKVPTVSFRGLLVLSLIILLIWQRRRPEVRE